MNKTSSLLVVVAALLLAAPLAPLSDSKSNNPCSACHGSRNQYLDILEGDAGNTLPTIINDSQTLKVAVVISVTGNTATNNVMSSVNATLTSQNGYFSVDVATYTIGSLTDGQNATAFWNITPLSAGNDTMVITARGRNTHNNMQFNDSYSAPPTIFVNKTPSDRPPAIVLTAPAANQRYTGGTNISVNWTVTDENRTNCLVNLYYTTDNFTSVNQTIATGLPAAQNYTWKTPTIDSGSVRVKATVTDQSGKFNQTLQGGVFTIDSTPPSVLSVMPLDKETNVSSGASILVNFSEPVSRSSAQLAFTISPDPGGFSWSWNAQNTTMTGSHNSFSGGTNYTCTISSGVKDISLPGNVYPGTFSWSFGTSNIVVPTPSIALSSPAGGERFFWGDQVTARWTASGGTGALAINISISENGTAGPFMPVVSGVSNNGQYSFSVPQLVSDSSVVRATVFDTNGMQSQAVSGIFAIARNLTLSAQLPSAGTRIRAGTSTVMNWTSAGGHGTVLVNVLFQQDSNSSVQTIYPNQPGSGSILWTAPQVFSTSAVISINASDDWGKAAVVSSEPFTIFINKAPRFVSSAPTSANVGSPYTYQAAAVDDDGDGLAFALVSGPSAMTMDGTSGKVDWTPTQEGDFPVTINVSDGHGGEVSQNFTVNVTANGTGIVKPKVEMIAPAAGQRITGTFSVTGVAEKGTRDIAVVQLRVDSGQWTVVSGIATWQYSLDTTGLANGNHTIEVRAFDGTDYSDTAVRTVYVDNPGGITKPKVDFITPTEGQKVAGMFTVTGVAEKGTRNITLVQLRTDSGQWTEVSGDLGWLYNLDTTKLSNGNHVLEARAFDGTDHSDPAVRTIYVDNPEVIVKARVEFITPSEGQKMTGIFTVTGVALKGTRNITGIQLRVDSGQWTDVSGNPGWQFNIDTTGLSNGNHILEARAFDGTDYSDTVARTARVDNPVPVVKPKVDFITPYEGQVVSGNISVTGVVEKGSQDIAFVQVRIDYRLWLNVSGNPGWQYMLDANRLRNGNHTIEVRAFDGTYYSDTAIRTIDVENPRPKSRGTVPMLDGLVIMALLGAVGAIFTLRRK